MSSLKKENKQSGTPAGCRPACRVSPKPQALPQPGACGGRGGAARTMELGRGAVHRDLHLALVARGLERLADQHQALLVGLRPRVSEWGAQQSEAARVSEAGGPDRDEPGRGRGSTVGAVAAPSAAAAAARRQAGPAAGPAGRTWMPGAKPPSSPTLTESTPYFFFTMALRWWYTSLPSCGQARQGRASKGGEQGRTDLEHPALRRRCGTSEAAAPRGAAAARTQPAAGHATLGAPPPPPLHCRRASRAGRSPAPPALEPARAPAWPRQRRRRRWA